jgi:tripartite-type tricarboxylate transporter receptor subunit TctC
MVTKFRKSVLATVGILAVILTITTVSLAADYPTKPITLIIPLGAGGSHDMNARVFTSVIPTYLGQPMIVKLMPGASGQKGTAALTKAKPDGYTLLFTHNFIDQLQQHIEKLPYDTMSQMITVWKLNDSMPLLFVLNDSPFKTLKELVAWGKANPRKLTFPHSGKWGAGFTAGAVLLADQGLRVKFVPYKGGGPARAAMLAGDGDFAFGRPSQLTSLYKAKKIRILAVGGSERLKAFPEVPSYKELGYPGGGVLMDRIVMAPRATPKDRIMKLRSAFAKLYKDKTFKKLIKQLNENTAFMDGAEYEKVRAKQSLEYKALVKDITGQ